ncbi:MAG: aminotransferase class V-fold PLP-dependent enzyme [Fimbriimonadaceae bacterium]|nr:aminotransferase class V-fold PLP-dependent enzyme [Fimbriimonadaceae bacterium]
MLSRRAFLGSAIAAGAFRDDTLDLVAKLVSKADGVPELCAEDEDFWIQIQQAFTLDRNFANFNNGGVCPSPRVVLEALERQLEYSNQGPSYLMWRHLEPEIESVRRRLAAVFGCDPEEMAITRNASEALEICLLGFDLEPGDEVLTSDLDYPRMVTTIKQRERRDGIKLVQVEVPPVVRSTSEIVKRFEQGITPRTRLILVSQVVFLNGQINPVREVCLLGRKRGIPVIVDGAHAFAQFPFTRDGLQCDYYGCSLHKWLMAPIGTGFLSVRKEKIAGLWPMMAAAEEQTENIRKFEEIGTHPAANHNAIAEALTFHELIGVERKAARLRALRSRWTRVLADEPKVRFHTNLQPAHSCGLTTVEVVGIEPGDLAGWLLDKHGVFVTGINHPSFKGIRVTPNVYTTFEEIDRFAAAMRIAAREGIA